MGDILKEAIADAKAVRETALQNAKMALEEAFTPQLKSMLSAKLKEEEDEAGEEVTEFEDEEEVAEDEVEAEEMADAGMEEDEVEDEFAEDEEEAEIAAEPEVEAEPEMEAEPEAEPELEVEPEVEDGEEEEPVAETLEINGHTYRLAEEDGEEEEVPVEESEEEDELELEAIIKELEDEMEEDDDEEEVTEEIEKEKTEYEENTSDGYEENVDGDKDEKQVGGDIGESVYEIDADLLEQSESSEIGSADNKVDVADGDDEEDPGANTDKPGNGVSGNIGEAYKKQNAELKEYKEAVKFLKDKLHEVNILNAKLLFTNKLFKEYVLDNNQKLRVVETFDRAQTVREIKLIFSTLAESFKNSSSVKTKKSITESASRKSGSTKPKRKIISEETKVADRFKKLAGLLN
tara:strand:- start:1521 stop:2738 length:1218 start_codon:yes stop_codon:yes gene_type:complete